LAERGSRRFSQAISEGDGISVIVQVDGPEAARMAEQYGAEAVLVRSALGGIREATELPILWHGGANPEDAKRVGADAMVVVAEDHDDDDDDEGLGTVAQRAVGLGLDIVVSVASEDALERVLELHDPETFHLAASDLERALDLLSDVPVGKLAIAEVGNVTREQVVELERRGVDAVIVPARNVAELVGGAPPSV
jgi:indole-3-glycerol phosphate synthase